MKVKFKKTGKVGINYGISGILEVKEGQEVNMLDAHADILIKQGIAEKVEAEKVEIKVESDPVEADTQDTFSDMKKKELQALLDDAGIEYESDANKPRLIELAIEMTEPVQD